MPEPRDWYLREWAKLRGKRQADMMRELGWAKNTAFLIWHGKQPYSRDRLNEVADWLQLEPHELLMRPEEALSIRRIRESALTIAQAAAEGSVEFDRTPLPSARRKQAKR